MSHSRMRIGVVEDIANSFHQYQPYHVYLEVQKGGDQGDGKESDNEKHS